MPLLGYRALFAGLIVSIVGCDLRSPQRHRPCLGPGRGPWRLVDPGPRTISLFAAELEGTTRKLMFPHAAPECFCQTFLETLAGFGFLRLRRLCRVGVGIISARAVRSGHHSIPTGANVFLLPPKCCAFAHGVELGAQAQDSPPETSTGDAELMPAPPDDFLGHRSAASMCVAE
jgi:hypothetical protein